MRPIQFMHLTALTVFGFVCGCDLFPQTEEITETISVSGTVIWALNDQPVEGIEVSLEQLDGPIERHTRQVRSTVTDENGHYSFEYAHFEGSCRFYLNVEQSTSRGRWTDELDSPVGPVVSCTSEPQTIDIVVQLVPD